LEPFQSAEKVKKNVDCMYPTSYFGYQYRGNGLGFSREKLRCPAACECGKGSLEEPWWLVEAQGSKSLSYCFREIERRENRDSHGLWVPFMKGGAVYYVLATNFAQICLTKRAAGLKKSDELVVYG